MRKVEKQLYLYGQGWGCTGHFTTLHPPLFHEQRLFVITSIMTHNSMLLCASEMLGLDLFLLKNPVHPVGVAKWKLFEIKIIWFNSNGKIYQHCMLWEYHHEYHHNLWEGFRNSREIYTFFFNLVVCHWAIVSKQTNEKKNQIEYDCIWTVFNVRNL